MNTEKLLINELSSGRDQNRKKKDELLVQVQRGPAGQDEVWHSQWQTGKEGKIRGRADHQSVAPDWVHRHMHSPPMNARGSHAKICAVHQPNLANPHGQKRCKVGLPVDGDGGGSLPNLFQSKSIQQYLPYSTPSGIIRIDADTLLRG